MDYKCAHCDKMFMQRQHLVVHERRHTGDKRHVSKLGLNRIHNFSYSTLIFNNKLFSSEI